MSDSDSYASFDSDGMIKCATPPKSKAKYIDKGINLKSNSSSDSDNSDSDSDSSSRSPSPRRSFVEFNQFEHYDKSDDEDDKYRTEISHTQEVSLKLRYCTWAIPDFSTSSLNKEGFINSKIYSAGVTNEFQWFFRIERFKQKTEVYYGVYVCIITHDESQAKMEFRAHITEIRGHSYKLATSKNFPKIDGMEFLGFLNKSHVRDNTYWYSRMIPDDKLTLSFRVHVQFKKFKNMLVDNLKDIWKSKKYTDAILVVKGKEIPVHKTILAARSPAFAEIFQENNSSRVQIDDFEPEVMEEFLRYIYTGFLIDFISGPVSVGFTSAAAIIIATSQLKDILGLQISGGKFLQVWKTIFDHANEIKLWDTALGFACIIVLLLLRKVKDIPVMNEEEKMPPMWRRLLQQLLWLVSTSRNILVVMACAVTAWVLEERLGSSPVVLTGHVEQGMPSFQLPPFEATIGNRTYDFFGTVSLMGSGCFIVPLLSILETIAIAKAFPEGKPIDATQEMLSIGLCNIGSSFVSSIPVSGGLSRGAVNHSSGVRTTFGGIYTGILVLISLQFLTPYLYFIPKASLGAVIIAAVVFMVEIQVVKPMWRTKKSDLVPALVTFLSCLFIQLEVGIFIGIGVNLIYLLYGSARPSLRISKATSPEGVDYLVITPDRSLVFPSVEYVRSMVSKQGLKQGSAVPVVIDSTHIQGADFTAAKGIKGLLEDFARRGQPLIFYNLKQSVFTIFQGVKPVELKCCYNEIELNEYLKEFESNTTEVTRQ